MYLSEYMFKIISFVVVLSRCMARRRESINLKGNKLLKLLDAI